MSGIKRHYTEAFAMRPAIKEALLSLAKNKDEASAKVIYDAIKANNTNDVSVTIKGYAQNKGLSDFIFKDIDAK